MSELVNFGEVGLVDRLGRAGVDRGDRERLLFLPWLSFSVSSMVWGSCARCPVLSLELMVVLVLSETVEEGEFREEQHPVGRGDGGGQQTSGVAGDEQLRAALRGVLGVVTNSGVLEDGVEFLTLRVAGFRCTRRST